MNTLVQPVIMAGGSGTRLWPLSRSGYPKQFLVLSGQASLFQQAVQRLQGLAGADIALVPPLVVGNEEHRFLVLDQMRAEQVEPQAVLLEPVGRNTAPALTLAALQALQGGHDPVLVVTPADQTVTDAAAFDHALRRAVACAAQGAIVILGITPDRPETGYGYIRIEGDGRAPAAAHEPPPKVARFVEKPDARTAAAYLAEGGYYWNAGMFVLKASAWMAALERFRPDIAGAVRQADDGRSTDARFVRPARAEFEAVPAESVDYAVMENTARAAMVPADMDWSDIGNWQALHAARSRDARSASPMASAPGGSPAANTIEPCSVSPLNNENSRRSQRASPSTRSTSSKQARSSVSNPSSASGPSSRNDATGTYAARRPRSPIGLLPTST